MRLTGESDGAGGTVDNFKTGQGWETVAPTWAAIRPASASTKTVAQQRKSEVTHEVLIRYREDFNEKDVIKYDGRKLEIDTIINLDEQKRYLKLECREDKVIETEESE